MVPVAYDVVVIGGGPGGYVAAIRCAQLGLNTACVESWTNPEGRGVLGGTCLNVGCIPSKALLDSSHQFHHFKHEAVRHGINNAGVTMDVSRMMKRKDQIVHSLTQGISTLLRKNKVTWIKGQGRLVGPDQVAVEPLHKGHDEKTLISARHIILATGSLPAPLSVAPVDEQLIVNSTGALSFPSVPRRLGIIGAGVIGLELGSVWQRLGSEVTLLEAETQFLPLADQQLANETLKVLKKQGLQIEMGAKVVGTGCDNRQVTVRYETADGKQQLTVEKLIVAVGRIPNSASLGAADCGLELDAKGFIRVDNNCQTNLPNVYAIGDVVRGPMLAHKASEEGVAVAERIAGIGATHCDFSHIPWVIYIWPELAWAGQTEQQLRAAGVDYRVGVFPMLASGRAQASGETQGMVKMLCDARSDRILGVHVLAANASELITEAVVAMAFAGSSEDLARTIHAHPTLTEAMHEAALAVDKRALHF